MIDRSLTGFLLLALGAVLIAGAAYQTAFRNPLISPDIPNVSAGGRAVLGILLGLPVMGIQMPGFGTGLLTIGPVPRNPAKGMGMCRKPRMTRAGARPAGSSRTPLAAVPLDRCQRHVLPKPVTSGGCDIRVACAAPISADSGLTSPRISLGSGLP